MDKINREGVEFFSKLLWDQGIDSSVLGELISFVASIISEEDNNMLLRPIEAEDLRNPGFCGCGGVLRNSSGEIISGFSSWLGIMTSIEAKFQGLFLGLQLSTVLHGMLTLKMRVPWRLDYFFLQIQRSYTSRIFQLSHAFREANNVADCLAKLGSPSTCKLIFAALDVLSRVHGLVRLDSIEMPSICFVKT
ncbi:hypothetical protein ACH5RR_007018 [Cinchona calisaya]|uniref:RNase H type-1 domain-containing protein n=1 Tax=Cinchona calisaya TaxID=153742 RepID=A0ABD3AQK7_9GENT